MKAEFPKIIKGTHFHLVGVKGTGVAALAELLAARGAVITGSDVAEVFYTDAILNRLGIKAQPFSGGNITDDIQCVVHSSAYSVETNPDLIEAARRGVPILLYTEALGAVSALSYSAGICGVHGKTSTAGLTGTILSRLPLDCQVLAGSVITSFGDGEPSCVMTRGGNGGARHYFAAETCEYQRHFMQFHPQKIVLTAIESDHQDYYPTYEDILKAFVEYLLLLPDGGEVIYCADDAGAAEAVRLAQEQRPDIKATPYGVTAEGDYHVTFGTVGDGVQYFSLGCIKDFALYISGRHEVLDAAAAVALSRAFLFADGLNAADYDDDIRRGVALFKGGKRRSEVVGRRTIGGNDTIFIDDYGHHPTAIRTTLAGYRQFYKGRRMVVDFMSHTHTRTAALLDEFAASFKDADDVIINDIYGSARERKEAREVPESPRASRGERDSCEAVYRGTASECKAHQGISVTGEVLAKRTAEHHRHVVYAPKFEDAAREAKKILSEPLPDQYPDGCLFVTMGAGDNWKVGEIVDSD